MRRLLVAILLFGGVARVARVARADVSAPPVADATAIKPDTACGKGRPVRLILEPRERPPGAVGASIPVARAREIVAEELARAKLTVAAEPFALAKVERVDEIRRYYSREMREKHNLPLHSNDLVTRPVHLDAFVPERGAGFLVLSSWLELAVHRALLRDGKANRSPPKADDWEKEARKALLAAAAGEPRVRALFLLGDPGWDREDELRRMVREAIACLSAPRSAR